MTTSNILAGGSGPPDAPAPPGGEPLDGSGAGGPGSGLGWGAGRLRALPDPERDVACCRLPLTDLGNAERWRVRFGADFRFCDVLGWFWWDARRWRLLSEEKDRLPARVMQSVFLTVRAIRNEAALVAASGCEEPEDLGPRQRHPWRSLTERTAREGRDTYLKRDEDGARRRFVEALEPGDFVIDLAKDKLFSTTIAAWAKTSEGAGKLNSVAALAKSFEAIAIEPEQLDHDRMAINVANGTLRFARAREKRSAEEVALRQAQGERVSEWRTGGWTVKLHPHDRGDLITKLAPVKFHRAARCAEYDAFVERVQPDVADRRFLHQWGGLSLTGDISEQKLAFFYGSGRNGKGTWVEAVAGLAGDYAGSIPIESFLESAGKRRGDQATPDIARLPGVRFLRVSEPEKGASLNEGLVKMVTGGDPVDARHLNKGFFTFLPSFKMTISGNHRPKIKDTSDGIWRRMQLLPWAVQIPEGEVDRALGDKLKAEAPGILNRLLDGLLDWLTHGLIEPESVRRATRAYRDDSDDLGRFLSAICEVSDDPAVRCGSKELHELYQAWAEAAGGATWHIKAFKTAMVDKGFEQIQSDGMKWLRVRPRAGVTLEAVKRGDWSAADDQDAFDPDAEPFDPGALDG